MYKFSIIYKIPQLSARRKRVLCWSINIIRFIQWPQSPGEEGIVESNSAKIQKGGPTVHIPGNENIGSESRQGRNK